jgi:hypothetical protein
MARALRTLAVAIAVCITAHASLAAGWRTTVLDGQFGTGLYNSISMDSRDNPRIAYAYSVWGEGNGLRYAISEGNLWEIESISENEGKGLFVSLALNSYDNPEIACADGMNIGNPRDLYCFRFSGNSWVTETVDSPGKVGFYCSLKLDVAGAPHVSYYDETNSDLKYAYKDCSGANRWIVGTVDSDGIVGEQTSLALDANQYPHIAYAQFHDTTRDLKYARWDGRAWRMEIVDRNLGFVFPSLALDSHGRPQIAYHDFANGYLKFARWDGRVWQIEVVDRDGRYGGSPSMALDAEGGAHIIYHDANTDYLKYAHWDGYFWHIEEVDDLGVTGDVLISKSLALDSRGDPHISYYDRRNSRLKYGRRIPEADQDKEIANDDAHSGGLAAQSTVMFALGQPGPNPCRASTSISYSIPGNTGAGAVTLTVFDLKGRLVKTLVDAGAPGVDARITWDGDDNQGARVPNGTYFFRLNWNGEQRCQRVILLR